jgi:para-aminobenzoate synthetase component I
MPGDPHQLLTEYLADQGITQRELGKPRSVTSSLCGAAVLLGASLAPGSRPSPAPAVPDLVCVVYEHRSISHVSSLRPAAGFHIGDWRPSWSNDGHASAISAVHAAIERGDVYQVNVVGHACAPYTGDATNALERVAALPGARYGGVLAGDGWAVACASPETFVEVTGRRVVTRPIKGTRPATAEGRAELLASAKERAEHVMIVDLERNDLARVAATGSVRVDELFAIRRWAHLWQAESTVSAELADGVGLADLLRAVFPGGSVTGAPKLAALDLIRELEPVGRGPSMGAIGWIGPDRIDLGLTIRTVAAADGCLHLWAGGGITWSSDVAAEIEEAAAKAQPLKAALRAAATSGK